MRVWTLAGAAFLVDRLSKVAVLRALPEGASQPLIPGIFHLTHVQNPGAAFSLLSGQTGLLVAFAVVALAVLAWASGRAAPGPGRAGLGLLLGGAAGNLVDRLATGTVTDFIDLRVWPVFNLADVAIVVGSALVGLQLLREGPAPSGPRPG